MVTSRQARFRSSRCVIAKFNECTRSNARFTMSARAKIEIHAPKILNDDRKFAFGAKNFPDNCHKMSH